MVAIAAALRDDTDGDAAVDDEGVATTPMRYELLVTTFSICWVSVGATPSRHSPRTWSASFERDPGQGY